MSIKFIVINQYREIIDSASRKVLNLLTPPEGWLRTNRKALQMPVSLILQNAGIKKSELYRIEKAEIAGTLTLNKLKETAQAMGCELHYAVVPRGDVKTIIKEKARRHAIKLLRNANVHMQLEDQGTTDDQIELQVSQVAEKLEKEMPDWFWSNSNDIK
jgi:predicted DNA-binding mobile mystery protein A